MNPSIQFALAIAIGAIPGALSRHYLTAWTRDRFGANFPYGTFAINLTGCFCIGLCFTLAQTLPGYPRALDLLIRTGFLGSYTTFSTYEFDTLTLWRNQQLRFAAVYWIGSAVLGVIAVYAGESLAQVLIPLFH